MNLIATPLKYEDYDNILVGWWNDWKWVAPQRDFLPQDGMGGMIVWDGDKPVCAGFIYNTNSKVSWIDWVISDINYKKQPERQDALELLLLTLGEVCKKEGNKYSYALLRHDKLIETYKKLGFRAGEQYSQEMIKIY